MKVSKVGFKAKTLVAAVALAASSMASAMVLPATGNGDLIFSIWDATIGHEASYTVDLGVGMNTALSTYLTPGTNQTLATSIFTNATYLSYFNATTHNVADLRWNVAAADTSTSDGERALVTGTLGSNLQLSNGNTQSLAGASANFFGYFGAANDGGASNPASQKYAGDITTWSDNVAGTVPQGSSAGVGGSLGMFSFMNTIGPSGYVDTTETLAASQAFVNGANNGTWTLSSAGNLTYSMAAAGPIVPVPAALWLLGSAMVGLVGVARRRTNEVA